MKQLSFHLYAGERPVQMWYRQAINRQTFLEEMGLADKYKEWERKREELERNARSQESKKATNK